ncbi:MAG: DUF4145 domain-containing protein [Myxococcota bacterium]|jgi:hypothetical protein|nr:DUF4145 domain-containing protein [Myxococcota bacterium]
MSDEQRLDQLSRKNDMLCELVVRAHGYAESDPKTALAKARESAEAMCLQIFADKIGQPHKPKLELLIQKLAAEELLPERVLNPLRTIQQYGNYGAHAQLDWVHVRPDYVATSLHALATVTNWYFDEYLCEQVPAEIRDLRVDTRRIVRQNSRSGFARPVTGRLVSKSTAARLRWRWRFALALLTLALVVGGLLSARTLWYPRIFSLTLDDTGADGPFLGLKGEHIATLSNWGEDWPDRPQAGVAVGSSTFAGETRSVTIIMENTKPTGLSWDNRGGAPDPFVIVDGTSYRDQRCQDKYTCVVEISEVGPVLIEIWDADLSFDDPAGVTVCDTGAACGTGNGATVFLRD